ncbi:MULTISPECIES: ATP-dependent DNA helicase [Kribbella]|uniref:ATP-dependent helicase DinG n=2 Tax=Kribbella TaxID=182639 RepID=A0A4R0HXF7_9ACTN|nr:MULTISPECIES: ATP-dependent DNA helicase [Kribbella]TCC16290.1 ATP-dependent DNA helicase [Kribbella sindirgiensis]TCC34456.1 ATP-dependent DNA helicase [Kribbella speibonae]
MAVGVDVRDLLEAAVAGIAGQTRPGQVEMAQAVDTAMHDGSHLLVQAGTGTGKSLGYLVPALLHAIEDRRVVVSTATLALQSQLVDRDVPALLDATEKLLPRRPVYAIQKGRNNYACLHRIREGAPDDDGMLVDVPPSGEVGRQVVELRDWAEQQLADGEAGDRDHAPSHQYQAWQQVAISARECLGAQKCPYGEECFAEKAKEHARKADIVITNHALLSIDAFENRTVLPEHDVVIVDEAHELPARVTGAAGDELSPQMVERAAKRGRRFVDDDKADDLIDASDALRAALDGTREGRIEPSNAPVLEAAALVRDAARGMYSDLNKKSDDKDDDPDGAKRQSKGAVKEIFDVAERVAALSDADVVWMTDRDRYGRELRIAPLTVAGLLRELVLRDRTAVLTSATLTLGGDFDAIARQVGLRPADKLADDDEMPELDDAEEKGPLPWRGLDVGSPFEYEKQAILYVAKHLPAPHRDGLGKKQFEEIIDLITAAGGRTLGLFSSRRAAEAATAAVREATDLKVLCQGDAQLGELAREFVEDPETSLFGTLSLWQGIDVPGSTCNLVIIDRIPFPRPDEPLMAARQRAVDEAGGNGFMSVAATHAGLLLAQGTGRLIRRSSDRGVVAILDPRIVTQRYGAFLRASLPPMWPTADREKVLGALKRLQTT